MTKVIKKYLPIILIVVISLLIRFYNLSSIPSSLYWDEVSIGYNAYSIGTTLKDEYGEFLPLVFKGFNDYKLPVDIYITALSIKIFGLNEWGVRIPSAFFGSLSIPVLFLLVGKILNESKIARYSNKTALVASFMLAVSPWHIHFSRANFEANIALFFILLGVYLFFVGLTRFGYLIASFAAFLIAMYTYRSADVVVPLLIVVLVTIYRKKIFQHGSVKVATTALVFIILLAPLGRELIGSGSARFQQTSIVNEVNEEMSKTIDGNRKLTYAKVFTQNYLKNLSSAFLFETGDPNPRHGARGMGILYVWEIPFLLLGVFILWRKVPRSILYLLTSWIVISILPAAISVPSPHALRALFMVPIICLLTALGIIGVHSYFPKKIKPFYTGILIAVILLSFLRFVYLYNLSATKTDISVWGDGYKQLVSYISSKQQYEKVIVSGRYWQPYMYFLFFNGYSPSLYHKNGSQTGFGRYIFGGTSWDMERGGVELDYVDFEQMAGTKNVLIALSEKEFKAQNEKVHKIDVIKNSKGDNVFIIGIPK